MGLIIGLGNNRGGALVKPIIVDTLPTASEETMNKVYLVPSASETDMFDVYYTAKSGSTYSWAQDGSVSREGFEIADNLTTNDATKALSAKQGKALADAGAATAAEVSALGKKLIKLTGSGTNGSDAGATQNGDTYYNTTAKELRRVKSGGYDVIPFYDGSIYTIGTELYVWNGTDLVPANGQYIVLPYTTDVATTRKLVPRLSRVKGTIISYYDGKKLVTEQAVRTDSSANWGNDSTWRKVLTEDNMIYLVGWGSSVPAGFGHGKYRYNTTTKHIIRNELGNTIVKPFSRNAIYIYNGVLYLYSGDDNDPLKPIEVPNIELNKRAAILSLEQGGVGQSTGNLVASNYRVRTLPFVGNFEVKAKPGYAVFHVASYNMDGTYYADITNAPDASRTEFVCQKNYNRLARIVFCKTDNTQPITPDDDIIASFVGGSEYGTQIDRRRIALMMDYRYQGGTPVRPTSAADIYAMYDGFVAKYPQYIFRASLGTSRPVTSFAVDSLINFPVVLTVSAEIAEGETIMLNGTHEAKVLGYYYSAYSAARYIYVQPNNWGSVIPNTGNVQINGVNVATYSNPTYRGKFFFNNDTSYYLDLSVIKSGTTAYGTIIGTGTPAASGVLKDEDGNTIANYSGLSTTAGQPVYAYTIDFSSRYRATYEVGLKNNILVLGGVHGYERKAAAGHMYFFNELFNNWKNDPALVAVRSACKFVVIPCVNPFGIDLEVNFNARGVDLNRNFTAGFEESPQMYFRWSGPEALSEPEAVAVNTKMVALVKTTDVAVDYHGEDGYQGSYIVSPTIDYVFANACSRAANAFLTKNYDLPSYLFGWTNGSTTIYTDTPAPSVGDKVYLSSSTLAATTITAIGSGTITYNGTTYNRDTSKYVDYTNMFQLVRTQGGMTMLQASALGIRNSSYAEVGTGYFLTDDEMVVVSAELFGNYIVSIIRWFFM